MGSQVLSAPKTGSWLPFLPSHVPRDQSPQQGKKKSSEKPDPKPKEMTRKSPADHKGVGAEATASGKAQPNLGNTRSKTKSLYSQTLLYDPAEPWHPKGCLPACKEPSRWQLLPARGQHGASPGISVCTVQPLCSLPPGSSAGKWLDVTSHVASSALPRCSLSLVSMGTFPVGFLKVG